MKYKSVLTTTLFNTVVLCAALQASASPVLPVPLTPGDDSGGFSLSFSPACLCLPLTDQRTLSGPVSFSNTLSQIGFAGSVGGSLTVINSPTPSINASALLSGANGLPPGGGSVSMGAVTNYSFEITGPTPTVSLMVNAQGGVGFDSLTTKTSSAAILSSSFQVRASNNGPVIVQDSRDVNTQVASASYSIASDFLFATNTVYDVRLQVGLSDRVSGLGTDSIFAFIDPSFTVDDPNAGAYSIFFSDGFGGGTAASATPIPAALPLFASGAGVICFLARRRKRKTATAA